MAAAFPHHYRDELVWKEGRTAHVGMPPRPVLLGGPPPEFDGRPEWWSPEHFLLSSVGLCFLTTFLAVADKAQFKVLGYSGRTEGTVDKAEGSLAFTSVAIHAEVKVAAADVEKAERALQTAKKHCLVSNSLKRPPELDAKVVSG